MVGEPFDLLVEAVAAEFLDRPDDPGVEGAPAFAEQTAICHLVGEHSSQKRTPSRLSNWH